LRQHRPGDGASGQSDEGGLGRGQTTKEKEEAVAHQAPKHIVSRPFLVRAAGKNDRKPQKTGHFRHFVRTLLVIITTLALMTTKKADLKKVIWKFSQHLLERP
jgi:hypothetical protein